MLCFVFFFSSSDFLYESICCWFSFELHRQVDVIQMGYPQNMPYKEVDKTYTSCSLKTMELLESVLIGVCAVIPIRYL